MEDAVLAGEYVLAVLDPSEMKAFERRLAEEPALAREVERWRAHFAALDDTAAPLAPQPALWQRIAGSLAEAGAVPEQSAETAPAPMTPTPAPRRVERAREGFAEWLWTSLGFWRGAAAAVAAAGLLGAVVLTQQLERARNVPVLIAVLQTDDNRPAALVNAFADGRTELVPLTQFTVPAGKVLEIWTLWDRAVGPRSVGLIQVMQRAPLRLDSLPLGGDQLFEITLEPEGGSPIGRPTGPILAKGLTARAL
jgi:anti-sigma-K factor RskA